MSKPLPNILLITVDQWRGDLLGLASHPFARTPNLDAFAKEGTRFAQHYCQAYPCGPARASLVTGLYAHKHRSVGNGIPLDARHPTIFTELRKVGYRPTLFGYTDTTLDPRGKSLHDPDNGDYENVCPGMVVDTLLTERSTPWLADLKRKGYEVVDPDTGRNGVLMRQGFGAPAIFSADHSETAFLTNRFLDWFGVVGEGRFCAHLSYIAPHPPFVAAAPYNNIIDIADISMPLRGISPDVEAKQSSLNRELLDRTNLVGFAPGLSGLVRDAEDATIRQIRSIYAGLAYEVDLNLAKVFKALKEAGRWDDTLIIFTADHGEQLFDHWMLGKTSYFDQSAHIPLIIKLPCGESGGIGHIVEELTESTDLMPTICALAGVPSPVNCDGSSLLGFCHGETPVSWRDEVHWSFDFRDISEKSIEGQLGVKMDWCNLQVIRTKNLKYVHFADLPSVLFDLSEDPLELYNRAGDIEAHALLLEGMERMLTWRQRCEETTLTHILYRSATFQESAKKCNAHGTNQQA